VSLFGEWQAPLLPVRLLPAWLADIGGDLGLRYITAANARETNFAPTFGLKIDFTNGLSLRGSATISNRYPTPAMSRRVSIDHGGGPGVNYATIFDPRRGQSYDVVVKEDLNPPVSPEGAVTQSAGLLYHRGDIHRFRASLDFADTRKENELLPLQPQTVLNLESSWPERVHRAPLAAGDPHAAGYADSLLTGLINSSWRHSQNWNASLDYTWTQCLGGQLDAYARLVYFQRYQRRVLPDGPIVDELAAPDGTAPGLLRWRSNFGLAWNGRENGFGIDGHYYHARILPLAEQPAQGGDHIAPFWQFDAFLTADLSRRLLRRHSPGGLTAQLRINNVLGTRFPHYANDASGAGVQAYGDWRGRVYSISLTTTF
jgi:outer membrane receptor protein involved in Fe transport